MSKDTIKINNYNDLDNVNGEVVIKLSKSLIGRNDKHIKTVHALGLRKTGSERTVKLTDALKKMIYSVLYLIELKEVKS